MKRINEKSVLMRVHPSFKELVSHVSNETGRSAPVVTRDFTYKIKRGFNLSIKDWF